MASWFIRWIVWNYNPRPTPRARCCGLFTLYTRLIRCFYSINLAIRSRILILFKSNSIMLNFKFKLIALSLVFGLLLVMGTVTTNHYMLKNSLIEYVDQRDQQHLKRIKNNIQFVLEEKGQTDLGFIDIVTWKKNCSRVHPCRFHWNVCARRYVFTVPIFRV